MAREKAEFRLVENIVTFLKISLARMDKVGLIRNKFRSCE
jgi:hypothetical protein